MTCDLKWNIFGNVILYIICIFFSTETFANQYKINNEHLFYKQFTSTKVCCKDGSTFHSPSNCEDEDQLGYEAIALLHSLIDDDKDGDVDIKESKGFIKEDLKKELNSVMGEMYHLHSERVSVEELWKYWLKSEIYNWTVNKVVEWVRDSVQLDQYGESFRQLQVTGKFLPRLASSQHNPLYLRLGIRNSLHKQRIMLQATDLILFGLPKNKENLKDLYLIISLIVALFSLSVGFYKKKKTKNKLSKLNKELKELKLIDKEFQVLQGRLEESQIKMKEEEDKREKIKKKLEKRKRIFKIGTFDTEDKDEDEEKEDEKDQNEVELKKKEEKGIKDDVVDKRNRKVNETKYKEKIQKLLNEKKLKLIELEKILEKKRKQYWPPLLQQWLQLTHEIELKYEKEKQLEVENQLKRLINKYEKMSNQRFHIFSAIPEQQSGMMETDFLNKNMTSLRYDLERRILRWRMIEKLTSFNISTNPGLPFLCSLLKSNVSALKNSTSLPSSHFNKASFSETHPTMTDLMKASIQLSSICLSPNAFDHKFQPIKRETKITFDNTLKQNSHKKLPPPLQQQLYEKDFFQPSSLLKGVKNLSQNQLLQQHFLKTHQQQQLQFENQNNFHQNLTKLNNLSSSSLGSNSIEKSKQTNNKNLKEIYFQPTIATNSSISSLTSISFSTSSSNNVKHSIYLNKSPQITHSKTHSNLIESSAQEHHPHKVYPLLNKKTTSSFSSLVSLSNKFEKLKYNFFNYKNKKIKKINTGNESWDLSLKSENEKKELVNLKGEKKEIVKKEELNEKKVKQKLNKDFGIRNYFNIRGSFGCNESCSSQIQNDTQQEQTKLINIPNQQNHGDQKMKKHPFDISNLENKNKKYKLKKIFSKVIKEKNK